MLVNIVYQRYLIPPTIETKAITHQGVYWAVTRENNGFVVFKYNDKEMLHNKFFLIKEDAIEYAVNMVKNEPKQ